MRARMTLLFAGLVALLLLVGEGAIQQKERQRALARVAESLQTSLGRARDEVAEEAHFHRPLVAVIRAVQGELAVGGVALLVVDAKNRVLWQSSRDAPDWPDRDDEWSTATLSSGRQTLVVAREWAPIEAELRERARALWELGALVVGATALLAWFVVGQTLSPLHKLAAQAQAQNASTDTAPVRLQSPSSDAEMCHLTGTLNDLLGRLEREAAARGRFYAAASHELRTPIQILLGEIDVARSRARTIAEHEQALAHIQVGTERLAGLVRDLLQLNALEMRQSRPLNESLDLAHWVERALDGARGTFVARGLALQCSLSDTPLDAPPAHVEMLLRNLIENAAKYATPGTLVRVELGSTRTEALLQIDNDCDLPEGAVPHEWFEPFFRPDFARVSSTGGNGLGLAICRSICATNGWTVALTPIENSVRAMVTFPLQPQEHEGQ